MKIYKIVVAILVATFLSACASGPSISNKEYVAQRQVECKAEGAEYRLDGHIMACVKAVGVAGPVKGWDGLWVKN